MARFKKGSKEAKLYMAKIRKAKVSGAPKSKRQTGTTNKTIDKRIQAKQPGKRVVKHRGAKSTTYTERRANRSDKGKLLGVGAMVRDFKTKHDIVIHQLADRRGEIATLKELIKHEPTRLPNKKAKYKSQIKLCEASIKSLIVLKNKLSKLK